MRFVFVALIPPPALYCMTVCWISSVSQEDLWCGLQPNSCRRSRWKLKQKLFNPPNSVWLPYLVYVHCGGVILCIYCMFICSLIYSANLSAPVSFCDLTFLNVLYRLLLCLSGDDANPCGPARFKTWISAIHNHIPKAVIISTHGSEAQESSFGWKLQQ